MWWEDYAPYVPVAQRRANALREIKKLARKGEQTFPVEITGRKISTTFWGEAWCDNLESYSDFSNRLPRGRTYVRNGSVVDLKMEAGKITALVSGSSVYRVSIEIKPLHKTCWSGIKTQCGGQIGSLVELLQGKLSKNVMEIVTRQGQGLFPMPKEIKMHCSCPDAAGMCKHIAATLYGVGNRLDLQPELLFTLRQVDHMELVIQATTPIAAPRGGKKKVLAAEQLADVFGIELEPTEVETAPVVKPSRPKKAARKSPSKQSAKKSVKKVAKKAVKKAAKKSAKLPQAEAPKKIVHKHKRK